ncbi:hypothetical protein IZU99_06160 [Oscillospiraceae bacterium CM]|nr:hypothetical protein IZU99_06160 [Oscillospiraceae bacterium CM]
MNVTLVVKVLNDEHQLIGAYTSLVKLPFLPIVGMKFRKNSNVWLWQATDGEELSPPVKAVTYNLDNDEIFCLFEVNKFLSSTFWTPIKNITNCHELRQFADHQLEPQY